MNVRRVDERSEIHRRIWWTTLRLSTRRMLVAFALNLIDTIHDESVATTISSADLHGSASGWPALAGDRELALRPRRSSDERSGSRVWLPLNGVRAVFHRPYPRPEAKRAAVHAVRASKSVTEQTGGTRRFQL